MSKTTCTTCGKPCEVPFRPDGIKPVLCRDCFATKNAAGTMPVRTTANDRTARQYEAPYTPAPRTTEKNNLNYAVLAKQLGAIETKVNKVLELIQPTERKVASTVIIEATDSVVKKTRKPKSTSPAVKKAAVKKKVAKKAAVAKKQA